MIEREETGDLGTGGAAAEAVVLWPPPPGRRIRCPACGGLGEPVEGKEGVCRCDDCAALFLNPRPSAGEVLKARNERFKGALRRNHSGEIRKELEAAQDAMRGYHRLASGKDAVLNAFGRKVLDLGCGLGFRMRECIHYGWTAVGLEPSANALAYTKALMLDVVQADFDKPPRVRFDLVLAEDLLDEIPEPGAAVAAARKVLGPKGVLFVSVGEPGGPDIRAGKLCLLNEESLRRMVMPAGFSEPRREVEGGQLRLWFPVKAN